MGEGFSKGTAVVTGASSGVGACYAEQLAERGFDVILVARNRARMNALASRLTDKTHRSFEVMQADLASTDDLERIERLLSTDSSITMLVNNAGIGAAVGSFEPDSYQVSQSIAVNLAALTRLTLAASAAFASRRRGTIIQVASLTAVKWDFQSGIFGAIAAYVLAYSRSLHQELSDQGVRLQVVLPEPKYRRFSEVAKQVASPGRRSHARSVKQLVRTALNGLDKGEFVSMASTRHRNALPDACAGFDA